MRRYIILTVLAVFFAAMFAACTDDPPKYTEGCNPPQEGRAIYERDFGCTNGTVDRSEHGEEGEDHEAGETEEHEAGESVEGESQEQPADGQAEQQSENSETEATPAAESAE